MRPWLNFVPESVVAVSARHEGATATRKKTQVQLFTSRTITIITLTVVLKKKDDPAKSKSSRIYVFPLVLFSVKAPVTDLVTDNHCNLLLGRLRWVDVGLSRRKHDIILSSGA